MSINKYLSIVFILSFIRFIIFIISFPNNFDNVWKPGIFASFPYYLVYIIVIGIAYTVYKLILELKQANNAVKNTFFCYLAIMYFFLSFFNRTFLDVKCSYIHLIEIFPITYDYLLPFINLDLFFEAPYTFWSILFMLLVYCALKKINKTEYTIPFWFIPISLVEFPCNDIILAMIFAYCIIALIGFKYSKSNNFKPIIFILLQFFSYLICIIYSYFMDGRPFEIMSIAIQTLIIFYIPTFIALKILLKKTNKSSHIVWFLPITTSFFLNLPLFRLPTHYCLTTFIAMINSFLFIGNISLLVSISFLIAYILKKTINISEKYSLCILSFLLFSFYSLDGILFYYSQFRLNYQTILWAKTMDNFIQTTFYTCLNYLSFNSVFFISLLTIVVSFLSVYIPKLITFNTKFRTNIIIPILISQICLTLLQESANIPRIFRDPFFDLLKSFPKLDNSFAKKSIEDIKIEFEKCNITLHEYVNQKPSKGNRNNVILITLESIHWRYLNILDRSEPKTWPKMSKLQDRMEIFPLFFCNYPESTNADFAMVSELIPPNQRFIDENPDYMYKTLGNELKNSNYDLFMFSSGSANDGRLINIVKTMPLDYFSHYNSANIDEKNNSWQWGFYEDYTTKKIIEYLSNRNTNNPYFLWYRTVYPHAPFPILGNIDTLVFKSENSETIDILDKYKNALIYIDSVLYDFIDKIDKLDKKNNQKTTIVMVGDHGEMLEEPDNNHLKGHGIFVSPQLTNVPCIIIRPDNNGLKINKNIGSQIDITPTILDCLDLNPSIKRFGQGKSLCSNNIASRTIYLSSMLGYALIEDGFYFEFPDKNRADLFSIRKLSISEIGKPKFEKISNWSKDEIDEKFHRTKKFFELQQQLLSNL